METAAIERSNLVDAIKIDRSFVEAMDLLRPGRAPEHRLDQRGRSAILAERLS
jgi:hypothetical protein